MGGLWEERRRRVGKGYAFTVPREQPPHKRGDFFVTTASLQPVGLDHFSCLGEGLSVCLTRPRQTWGRVLDPF